MEKLNPIEQAGLRSRWLPPFVIALSLLVFAGVVVFATLHARIRIREQFAVSDAVALLSVVRRYRS